MSLLKTIRQQLGLSNTAANNFTLDASAADGTMKLARGNAGATTQDILTVDVAGKVNFPQNAQTWQVVSRQLGTYYQNTSGQAIDIAVSGFSSSGPVYLQAYVDYAELVRSAQVPAGSQMMGIYFRVPANSFYAVTVSAGTGAISIWKELR